MAAIDVYIEARPTVEITHQNVFVGGVVTEQINGVTIGTAVSGSTNNQVIENTIGTPVGTSANPSVVPDATVTLNGIVMTDIPSGVTDNIEVRQSTGATQVGSKQGVHWRIDDSTIQNSDGSYSVDVKAEDSLVLPNITFTDSDGSTSSVPSVQDITATPCAIPATISLSLSDSNPDLGDSVTITATPSSGYVPTSYTFSLPRINGKIKTVTQVSNVYVWTAEGNGTETINVCSTDGTDTAANMISVDVVFPFVADEYASMSASYGMFKASSSYTGNWAQFQRQSDGAYLEVGWVNGVVPDFDSLLTWAGMSRARMTILYDSTGNGNHLIQATQSLQFRMVEGSVKVSNEGLIWVEQNHKMLVQSGGTLPPNATSYVDVYYSCEISYNGGSNAFLPIMQLSVNSWFMLRGESGSTSTGINNAFGSPTYYLNGLLSGWSTRGDVYSSLYQTGRNQITIIGGDTSSAGWLLATIGGSQDFSRYWEGGMGMYWFWTTSTAAVRTEIEEKYNRLTSLNIR